MARLSEALATLLRPDELRATCERARWCATAPASCSTTSRSTIPTDSGFSRFQPAARAQVSASGWSVLGRRQVHPVRAAAAFLRRARAGRILIDGQDIARVDAGEPARGDSRVPQDISLFHRSIMENIRYGRPEPPMRTCWRGGRGASATSSSKPARRFATIVGDRGVSFGRSAPAHRHCPRLPQGRPDPLARRGDLGARQRIRGGIREGPRRLMRGRTVIAIAHRLSTLRSFDRIVVLQEGPSVQDGPPDKLMRRDELIASWSCARSRGLPRSLPDHNCVAHVPGDESIADACSWMLLK